MNLLSNAFNDPSNPWYYVLGTLFLLLIFAALAVYIVLQKKFGKKSTESEDTPPDSDANAADKDTETTEQSNADTSSDAEKSEKSE